MRLIDIIGKRNTNSFSLNEEKLPVRTKSSMDWERLLSPNRFKKRFKFKNRSKMMDFLNDVVEYENEVVHHAQITIRYKTVTFEVWTHGIKDITEVDVEYARMVNEIYKDNNVNIDE
jgi:4a-hydroxytetrahydrobiopterin dehydratase